MTVQTDQRQAESALVIYRPLVEKVVAALGALITHQLAYLVVSVLGLGITATSDHAHLSMQWAIVAPLAVGGAASFIVWQLRSLGFRSAISAGHLAALVVGFFLVQESIEAMASGFSPDVLVSHPAIWAGILIGPFVGWLLSKVLASVTDLAARFFSEPGFHLSVARVTLVPAPVRYRSNVPRSLSRPRAPPSAPRI